MLDIKAISKEAYETSHSKGWWDNENERSPLRVANLIRKEISDAYEVYRMSGEDAIGNVCYLSLNLTNKIEGKFLGKRVAKGNAREFLFLGEMADIVIRICDYLGFLKGSGHAVYNSSELAEANLITVLTIKTSYSSLYNRDEFIDFLFFIISEFSREEKRYYLYVVIRVIENYYKKRPMALQEMINLKLSYNKTLPSNPGVNND